MKVLLVYPLYPDTFWSFKRALSYVVRKAAFPPLGLLTVASLFPNDWDVRLVDMNVKPLKDQDIAWADMVFISAMIVQKDSAQNVINRVRQFGKKIVVGGPYFTSCDHHDVEGADHWVLNEAEITLPPFIKDLKMGTPRKFYTSEEKPCLTETPIPRWDLINFRHYSTMLVQYTRGCPFNCEFCDITKLFGRTTRSKGTLQFICEIQALYDAGWRGGVFVVDDNFIGNIRNVKAMLPELIEWQKEHNYPFSFLTEASVNMAKDSELMALMRDAGFNKVFLGIETPNRESLKECHKGQNVNIDLAEAVYTIQQFGIEVMGGFIVGFDNDTPQIFADQISFIQKTGIVVAMVGMLNALPKTDLWKRLKEANRLLHHSTGDNVSSIGPNFVPVMDKNVLVKGYKHLLAEIYSPKGYYARVNTLLKRLRSPRSERVTWREVVAFAQSIVRIGLLSQARFRYWMLLTRYCFNRRKFSMAVNAAIVGEHLMSVARKVVS